MIGNREAGASEYRVRLLSFVTALLFLGLFCRAFSLQVLGRRYFRLLAQSNARKEERLPSVRGAILDRRGRPLAIDNAVFDLVFLPRLCPVDSFPVIEQRLGEILGPLAAAERNALWNSRRRPLKPFLLRRSVERVIVARVKEREEDLPGVRIVVRARRTYPLGPAAAAVTGYLGEVTRRELVADPWYEPGDKKGRAGAEGFLERILRGEKGLAQWELTSKGDRIEKRVLKEPRPGRNVRLTIDAQLQEIAYEAMGESAGAVVAIEPSSGEILSLVSTPSYDPEVFVDPRRSDQRRSLLLDPRRPLFNRALQATYPPGSTFKIVTMIAGLASGRLTPGTTFRCAGEYEGMGCWKKEGHGTLALSSALAQSCNVYFYQAGERVGTETLVGTARTFGLGERLLPAGTFRENPGVLPSPEWERRNVPGPDGEHWGLGDLRNMAIGQGYLQTTPLQMAVVVATAVEGGLRRRLRLFSDGVPSVQMSRGETEPLARISLNPKEAEFVRTALSNVVRYGTARRAWSAKVAIGGKTGTAQSAYGPDHAWFIAAAPIEAPRLALAVLVESAGHGGGRAAAPRAKRILERYWEEGGLE